MGSKHTKNKKNSVSALEDHSFQTRINTEMNAKIGKIIDELVKPEFVNTKPIEVSKTEEKENLQVVNSDNNEIESHLVTEVSSTKSNEQDEKKPINPIIVTISSENLTKHKPSVRIKRLQKRTDSVDNRTFDSDEAIFKKSKRKGVRFSEDVIVINDIEQDNPKNKRKSSIIKTEYIRLVSFSNFVSENKNSKTETKKTDAQKT